MRHRVSIMIILTLLAGVLCASGCVVPLAVGAAAGYGAYTYAHGDLDGLANAGVDRTWRATLAAMDQLELAVREQHKEATRARVRAVAADGAEVRVSLERRSGDFTRINVRVGTFGDESRSRLIIDTIRQNL
jgi:hypothetical protein